MPSSQSTRFTGTVIGTSLGAIAGVVVGAGVALSVVGDLQVRDAINFTPNGTTTGAVIEVVGVTAFQRFPVPCTSTGGLKKYPTCITASPFSSTGALSDIAIDCGNNGRALVMSGAFVKSNAATTEGQLLLKNVTVGTGAVRNRLSQTGSEVLWNPADKIRLSTVTAGANQAANCTMWVTARDKSGS